MIEPFKNRAERDAHLQRYRSAESKADSAYDSGTDELYAQESQNVEQIYKEYFQRLPVFHLSVCPYCNATYQHDIDPFGFGGLFWGSVVNKVETNCEHACLIRSAYTSNSAIEPPILGKRFSLGPEIPYVIGRILEMNSMKAVVSKIEFDSGDILYPIVYFTTDPPAEFAQTADWDNREYKRCDVPHDIWDFNLRHWVESGHAHWCEQGAEGLVLGSGACPFFGMDGHTGKQFIYPDGRLSQAQPGRRHVPPEGRKP